LPIADCRLSIEKGMWQPPLLLTGNRPAAAGKSAIPAIHGQTMIAPDSPSSNLRGKAASKPKRKREDFAPIFPLTGPDIWW
jgi:hypothetical protein